MTGLQQSRGAGPRSRSAKRPREPGAPTLYGVWFLAVISVVAWRRGVLFDGGVDAVVVSKALLQGGALAWAAVAHLNSGRRHAVGVRSITVLALIVSVGVVGGAAAGNGLPTLVLAVRLTLLAATLVLMYRVFSAGRNLRALLSSMALIGLVSAATGWAMGGDGRLAGGFPPLSPNEIALLAGAPALALLHEAVRGRVGGLGLCVLAVLTGVLVLSQSRTSLLAASVAALLVLVHLRRFPFPTVAGLLLLAPVVYALVAYTPMVGSLVYRSDSASILTLNSRTISWEAVAEVSGHTWERWIGQGLSVKKIEVVGQEWETQAFDSSWVSVLAQAGVVGLLLLVLWMAGTVWGSLRNTAVRTLTTPLLVFVLIRSLTENGLTEASASFLLFLSLCLCVEAADTRARMSWDLRNPFAAESALPGPAGP